MFLDLSFPRHDCHLEGEPETHSSGNCSVEWGGPWSVGDVLELHRAGWLLNLVTVPDATELFTLSFKVCEFHLNKPSKLKLGIKPSLPLGSSQFLDMIPRLLPESHGFCPHNQNGGSYAAALQTSEGVMYAPQAGAPHPRGCSCGGQPPSLLQHHHGSPVGSALCWGHRNAEVTGSWAGGREDVVLGLYPERVWGEGPQGWLPIGGTL